MRRVSKIKDQNCVPCFQTLSLLFPCLEYLILRKCLFTVLQKMVKFVQWTRFMASLIGCAEHWKVAQPVSSLNEMPWRAPVQWYHHSKIHRANLFEGYLKQKWGDKLIQTVNFEFPNIAWWNDVEVNSCFHSQVSCR
jgi:hypothetical protein